MTNQVKIGKYKDWNYKGWSRKVSYFQQNDYANYETNKEEKGSNNTLKIPEIGIKIKFAITDVHNNYQPSNIVNNH